MVIVMVRVRVRVRARARVMVRVWRNAKALQSAGQKVGTLEVLRRAK